MGVLSLWVVWVVVLPMLSWVMGVVMWVVTWVWVCVPIMVGGVAPLFVPLSGVPSTLHIPVSSFPIPVPSLLVVVV